MEDDSVKAIVAMLPTLMDEELVGAPPDIPMQPGKGDIIMPCTVCHRDCWVTPLQIAVAVEHSITPVCYYCAVTFTKRANARSQVIEIRLGQDPPE